MVRAHSGNTPAAPKAQRGSKQGGWISSFPYWDQMCFTNRETGTHQQCTCHPRSGQPLGS